MRKSLKDFRVYVDSVKNHNRLDEMYEKGYITMKDYLLGLIEAHDHTTEYGNETSLFKVMVSLQPDGEMDGEYSGVYHTTLSGAVNELVDAKNNSDVLNAYVVKC